MGSAASPADRIFRFGQFELSEGEGELRKNGVRIKLQEQPFQVLVELLANSGKFVTREHLQQKLWPADTFVDFDVGLNTAIRKIRQALGDDADHPHYIETAAKRGYRFLAPVNKTTSAPGLVSENAAPPEPVSDPVGTQPETVGSECAPASEKYRRWYLILTALAVVALAAGALWRARWGAPHPVVEKRITANSTEAPIRAAVVSPDGKYVAYADPTGVYLRQIDGGETAPLRTEALEFFVLVRRHEIAGDLPVARHRHRSPLREHTIATEIARELRSGDGLGLCHFDVRGGFFHKHNIREFH